MATTRRSVTRVTKAGNSELIQIKKIAVVAAFASVVFLGTVFYLVNNETIALHPKFFDVKNFPGFASKAEYALRYQVLLLFWLSFNVHLVIYNRLTTGAINPLIESTEKNVNSIKNVLTNSIEHIFLSFFAQLTFISFADPSLVLKFIPAINITQFIGRVLFWLGYPNYRTFGFFLTSAPNTCLILYNMYKFVYFVGLF